MKNIVTSLVVSIIICLAFASCSKSSTATLPTIAMTADAGIHSFNVSSPFLTATNTTGTLSITGTDTTNHRTISLTINNFSNATGTVFIGNGVTALYDSSANSMQTAVYGSITFTAVTPLLIGTFNFYCPYTNVTNGTFSVVTPF